jgi:chromatin remodeling complex protein RSC6
MVRISKADKTSTPAATAPAPTASLENTVVKTAKPRTKKTATESAPVVDATSTVVSADVVDVVETSVSTKLNEFSAKLQQISSLFASVKSDFKTLEKVVSRELKNAQKSKGKGKKASGNRQPSGFVKPTRISDELAKFLGKDVGVEMARTSVSKEINAYIREKGLQDPANGRKINPDANLTKLLNIKKDDELTYFNLQRYMKHHFIKEIPAVPAVPAVVV